MKKSLAALALLFPLAAAVACNGAVTGTPLVPNWYSNTTVTNISETKETLTYAVTFAPETISEGVSLSYDEGTYTILFEDVTNTPELGLEGIPVGFHGYHLHSELNVTGRFAYNGTKGEDFTDTVLSDVWFMGVSDSLRPIRSEKKVQSHTPNVSATSEKDAGLKYDYTYTVSYNDELTEAKTVFKDNQATDPEAAVTEKTVKIKNGNTFFDNEQLLLVLRALDTTAAIRISTINPVKGIEESVASSGTPVVDNREVSFEMNGAPSPESLDAYSVSVGYQGAHSGMSQTIVFAKKTSDTDNTYRCVPLSMSVPALQSLGSLRYTLKKATFSD